MSGGGGDEDGIRAWLEGFLRNPSFLERYPCYAAVLARLTPVLDPSVQRMAVSLFEGRFFLHVNADTFVREPVYLAGVLLHEVHHVALGHLTHPKFAAPDERELMELALEMSANEFIEEPLPNPIRWQTYASLGLHAGQSTLERYDALVRAARAGHKVAPLGQTVDDHRHFGTALSDPGGIAQTRALLADAAREAQELSLEREGFARALTIAGATPAQLIEQLSGALGPSERPLDWRSALRMFVATLRAPVHTYARPNRRFPGRIGEVPGRTYARRSVTKPELLVAIDTSMSVERGELDEISRQLTELAALARITIVECDARVQRSYAFDGRLDYVQGRGGTDLRPVFSAEFLGARRVDGVVYFTDGLGPTPEQGPALPLLWILTKPLTFSCPFGQRVWLVPPAPRLASGPPGPR